MFNHGFINCTFARPKLKINVKTSLSNSHGLPHSHSHSEPPCAGSRLHSPQRRAFSHLAQQLQAKARSKDPEIPFPFQKTTRQRHGPHSDGLWSRFAV